MTLTRHTELKRTGGPKRRTELRGGGELKRTRLKAGRRKTRNRAEKAEWDRVKEAVAERSGGLCEVAWDHRCEGVMHHAHHVWTTQKGGPDTEDNALATCAGCHARLHANPALARRRGLLAWTEQEAASAAKKRARRAGF